MTEEMSLEGPVMCLRRRKSPGWCHGFWHACLDVITYDYEDKKKQGKRKENEINWELVESKVPVKLQDEWLGRWRLYENDVLGVFFNGHLPPVLVACGNSSWLPAL